MKYILLSLLSVSLLFTSCATLVNGSKQQVAFSSEPPGAEVIVVSKGEETTIGKTPLVANIPRKTKRIFFQLDGYYKETYEARANADIHWLYWLDLLGSATIIPPVVDLVSGGYILLEPKVSVELKKKVD